MPEGKQQSWSMPLRVRFRAHAEPLPWTHKEGRVASLPPEPSPDAEPTAPSLPVVRSATLQQNRQVKELIRLGNVLRAELGLSEVLEQVASSITLCTGFRASVIMMIEGEHNYLKAVAFAGVSEENRQTI